MLQALAPNLWHTTHHFKANGLAISSRMTVVRLASGKLWLHSPVPFTPALQAELKALGEVGTIVAPNKMHHLFAGECAALYPEAQLYGAPGLRKKRPDLNQMQDLPAPGTGATGRLTARHIKAGMAGNPRQTGLSRRWPAKKWRRQTRPIGSTPPAARLS